MCCGKRLITLLPHSTQSTRKSTAVSGTKCTLIIREKVLSVHLKCPSEVLNRTFSLNSASDEVGQSSERCLKRGGACVSHRMS